MPEEAAAQSPSDLQEVRAEVTYSDGSRAFKDVLWDIRSVGLSAPGVYEVKGQICRQAFPFPLARGYGDPVVFPWEGKWYFLGTNDIQDTKRMDSRKTYYSKQKRSRCGKNRSFFLATNMPPSELETVVVLL